MKNQVDVKELRGKLGLTQAELGRAIGVDQSTISGYESGKTPRGPALKMLAALDRGLLVLERGLAKV